MARRIIANEIDLRAREQSITYQHEMFGRFSVKSRVFEDNGLVVSELEESYQHAGSEPQPAKITRDEQTCGPSREGLLRIARAAAIVWREQALQQISN